MKMNRFSAQIVWALLTAVIGTGPAWSAEAPDGLTSIYIVRHAEKDAGTDPALTDEGLRRADHLAYMLSNTGLDAVFVRAPRRVHQTGAPVAAAAGLNAVTFYSHTADVVEAVKSGFLGGQILIVGHSNTLDDIAAGFGVTGLSDLADHQYDRLYLVQILPKGAVSFQELRYGAPTP